MIKNLQKFKDIRIHREGTRTLVYGFMIYAVIALLLFRFENKLYFWLFTLFCGTIYGIVVNFYRCPARRFSGTDDTEKVVVAPADGKIVSLITFAPEAEQSDLQVLTATANGYGKRTPIADYSRKNKGGQGNIAINTGERNGDLVAATLVSETDDLMLITSGGVLIRTKVEQIRETGRAAAGVRLINLDEGEQLVSLERVAEEPEDASASGEENTTEANVTTEDNTPQ